MNLKWKENKDTEYLEAVLASCHCIQSAFPHLFLLAWIHNLNVSPGHFHVSTLELAAQNVDCDVESATWSLIKTLATL